ncbi:MAG TPA: 50S ribosomal protein L18a [Candidatus Nanopusillus sp.]|nr:50S ribosomal protein L18a [Candidatus Nanopusillus sp.]
MDKKVFRIKGVIVKRKLLRPKIKKEGLPTYRRVVITFERELVAVNEKDALEKIYSLYGGIHRVKRFQIKIKEIKEVPIEEVKDLQLKKFLLAIQNGEI